MPDISIRNQKPLTINNIFCIGRNYVAHVEELGNTIGTSPVVFLKPTSAVIFEGERIRLPAMSSDVHYEAELVVAIGGEGKNVSRDDALGYVAGYGLGLDLTMRDVQTELKSKGLPWTIAKGFDTSAPLSEFLPSREITDPQDMTFTLRVNGELRQTGKTGHMIFTVADLVSYLSSIFTLHPGDLVFTGTPRGVGRLVSGDTLALELGTALRAEFHVA